MYNPYSLSGKTILVTGASSGIGKATAVECSRLGAKLILVGRNKERLEETFSQLEGEGHIMRILDLTDVDALEKFVKELPEIHGCVNNAGIGGKQPIAFIKREELQHILNTNFSTYLSDTISYQKEKDETWFIYGFYFLYFWCLFGGYW